MKFLWRCEICRPGDKKGDGRFVAEEGPHGVGVCPKCAAGETERSAQAVRKLVPTHFEPMSPRPNEGTGRLACGADYAGRVKTPVPKAVTCPACLVTGEYADAVRGMKASPKYLVEDPRLVPGDASPVPPVEDDDDAA